MTNSQSPMARVTYKQPIPKHKNIDLNLFPNNVFRHPGYDSHIMAQGIRCSKSLLNSSKSEVYFFEIQNTASGGRSPRKQIYKTCCHTAASKTSYFLMGPPPSLVSTPGEVRPPRPWACQPPSEKTRLWTGGATAFAECLGDI